MCNNLSSIVLSPKISQNYQYKAWGPLAQKCPGRLFYLTNWVLDYLYLSLSYPSFSYYCFFSKSFAPHCSNHPCLLSNIKFL